MNADSTSMALLTNNLSDATLEKVKQFIDAKDVWFKSYRLFNRMSEDKAYGMYGICQFQKGSKK